MPISAFPPGPTIALLCLLIAFLCGIVRRYHPEPALRLLSLGALVGAIGMPVLIMRPSVPELVAISVGDSLVLLALALFWQSVMRLYGRPLSRWGLAAAPLLWLTFCTAAPFRRSFELRVETAMVLVGALVFLPLLQLLRVPRETKSHQALIVVGSFHIACCAVRGVLTALPELVRWQSVATTIMPFEMMSYVILWPGFMLTLVAERAVLQARAMALHDDMTGVMNRRGFWQAAETLPQRGLLLFDIDHFKRINDTYGHASGDNVIRHFSRIATATLGADVVFGRIGGEEFAAAFSGLSPEALRAHGERVRIAFATAARAHDIAATVSAGLATPATPDLPLGDQMAIADWALYRAKRLGRNRVEGPPTEDPTVPGGYGAKPDPASRPTAPAAASRQAGRLRTD
ncbi:diguanylate cyclase [Gluconacetobacter johannae DSM 13595]|uniref:diguanylate cyclase n=1 Tax=Gluconacetobacter johannae TaxID=112140 RepID=A0A7W4J6H6_9PROT|nr:GGDEF domain-containing protein [Gluconacetobacter johannae]MBB2175388.1 GGDEF domain-containing protein [Gluconacetobacter johannae]GBQ88683.1 diguanylate cyclase [Gluconacetobacter johannae DSM 13595]